MRRGTTKLDKALVDLKANIELIEQQVKKTEGPYGSDAYPKQQVEGWISDLKKVAQTGGDLKGAEAQVKILLEAMNIKAAPVQKPVSRLSQAIRRGSGAKKEVSQSIEQSAQASAVSSQPSSRPASQVGSTPSSASASPQVTRANPAANTFKVTDAQLKTIIAKEKELSRVVQEMGNTLDPQLKSEINRHIQAIYQYEARLNTAKPVEVTADTVIAALDGMKNLVDNEIKKEQQMEETSEQMLKDIFDKEPTENELREASVIQQTDQILDDIFKDPTDPELDSQDAKESASDIQVDNQSATKNAVSESPQQEGKAANRNLASETPAQEVKASNTNTASPSPQQPRVAINTNTATDLAQQGKETNKIETPPASPTQHKGRIKLVGLKESYKNQSAPPPIPPKPSLSNPMIQAMLVQSKAGAAKRVTQNEAQEPAKEKTKFTVKSGPK